MTLAADLASDEAKTVYFFRDEVEAADEAAEHHQKQATMVGLPDEEAWARDCLRAALPGCAVDQHDDSSEAGVYDLTITYRDGDRRRRSHLCCGQAAKLVPSGSTDQPLVSTMVIRRAERAAGLPVVIASRQDCAVLAGGPFLGCAGGPLP